MDTKNDEIYEKIRRNIDEIMNKKITQNCIASEINLLTQTTISLIDSLPDDESILFYNQLENAYIHACY